MGIRFAGAVALAVFLLGAGTSFAAKPKQLTQKQYAELKLKQSFTTWAKKNLPGTKVTTVTCVLPKSGVVVQCTVAVSAPANRENIVFKVRETLHETGVMSWTSTSHSCTDSKTGKKLAC